MSYTTVVTLGDLHRAIADAVIIPLARLRNSIPLWQRIVPLVHNTTMRRFSLGGPGWAPLAPRTIAQRIKEGTWRIGVGSDQPILQRYGHLRQSLIPSEVGGSLSHTQTMTPRYFSYGTNLKKAAWLQGELDSWIPGAPRSAYSTRLAPRPFLYLDENDQEAILDQAVIHVLSTFEKAN